MTKYNLEFKLKVVKEYLEGNIGYLSLAKKYNIKSTTKKKFILTLPYLLLKKLSKLLLVFIL